MVHLTRVTFSVLRTILHDTKIKLFLEKKMHLIILYFVVLTLQYFSMEMFSMLNTAQHCSTVNLEYSLFKTHA